MQSAASYLAAVVEKTAHDLDLKTEYDEKRSRDASRLRERLAGSFVVVVLEDHNRRRHRG
jgi:hypothetical protein